MARATSAVATASHSLHLLGLFRVAGATRIVAPPYPAKTTSILFDVLRYPSYPEPVIVSFKDSDTRVLFETRKNQRWTSIGKVAIRKLDQLEASSQLNDLRIPPGNHLEALRGERAGQHSIRINNQYRICFVWKADGAHDVEITDYH